MVERFNCQFVITFRSFLTPIKSGSHGIAAKMRKITINTKNTNSSDLPIVAN